MRPLRVVVVGAGVTGLTAAYRLLTEAGQNSVEVTVVEASASVGGKLAPLDVGGIRVEGGADSFVARKPWAMQLCGELGLQDDLVYPGASGAFVWTRGRLVPYPEPAAFGIPADVESLLRWPGMTTRGRARAAMDLFRKPGPERDDESIESLATRRLGPEATRVLVGPLLAGINAGDPGRLSVRATFPELADWERRFGSLIRGARAARRAAREGKGGPMFATLDGGLKRLSDALVTRIGESRFRPSTTASSLRRVPGGSAPWEVTAGSERLVADAVVLATPAFVSARLLTEVSADAAGDLGGIRYVSTAAVTLAYPEGTGPSLPDATGFIVPASESVAPGRPATITACTWVSRKWPERSFGDRAVVRAFVGRDGDQRALSLSDDDLAAAVAADVERAWPMGAAASSRAVVRWERAMPQYEVGHLDRVDRIRDALRRDAPGVFVAGSAYRGVGIADCVRQGAEAAEAVLAGASGDGGAGQSAAAGRTRPGGTDPERTEAVSWTT
jgi:oxygen-dependent protoporphyrinogen oxidase